MIFIDTSFFIALLSPRDRRHEQAVRAFEAFEGQRLHDTFLTTNNVVLETITVAGRHGGHALAVAAGDILYAEKLARLYRTTAADEHAAFEYLRQHQDKRYSAVDCLSFVVMLAHGIDEAFAFDQRDFSHRFVVRPAEQ